MYGRPLKKAERFLITQDLDFSDIRRYTPETHHGIFLVRLRDPGRNALLKRVHDFFTFSFGHPSAIVKPACRKRPSKFFLVFRQTVQSFPLSSPPGFLDVGLEALSKIGHMSNMLISIRTKAGV